MFCRSSVSVLQVELHKMIHSIDDVLAVGFDTYNFRPSKFVFEFYHEGEVTIGLVYARIVSCLNQRVESSKIQT
ncbi:CDI toxin immunity protein [Paenibacillus allorhizosphaerae]